MNRQLRIDFPDYTPQQQEIDANRHERAGYTEVYLSKVDGVWNALVPRELYYVINGNNGEDLTMFCKRLRKAMQEDFKLKPKFRCIQNSGIDEYFKRNMEIIRRFNNGRDLERY